MYYSIYRIEHPKTKKGIFNHHYEDVCKKLDVWNKYDIDILDEIYTFHNRKFPSASWDNYRWEGYKSKRKFKQYVHYCGFNSLDELKAWINKQQREFLIKECGFKVFEIRVSKRGISNFQSIFNRRFIKEVVDLTQQVL